MNKLTDCMGAVEVVCDGDHSLGRKTLTIGNMIYLFEKSEMYERQSLGIQEVLERTAEYDMSLMDEKQNAAYAKRLIENRERLEMKKLPCAGTR
ncbi:hypothetical protein [Aneurinibacillus terranovensis]|uniref:hypothetical protein n=1 Tax=Aneurinibacillus terranovensis TaxID=278991 RepID=UPI000483C98E|nr:hypothetical protein [Aneurinibacillus terranovensis]